MRFSIALRPAHWLLIAGFALPSLWEGMPPLRRGVSATGRRISSDSIKPLKHSATAE
jgi:hypothetical protein